MTSDEPDYSACTYDELIDVKRRIDKEAFPERYQKLLEEIELKKELPKIEHQEEIESLKRIDRKYPSDPYKFKKRNFIYELLLYPILYFGVIYIYQLLLGGVSFLEYKAVIIVMGLILGLPLILHWLIMFRFFVLNHDMEVKISWNKEIIEIKKGGREFRFGFADIEHHQSEYCFLWRLPWSNYTYSSTRLKNGKNLILSSFIYEFELPAKYDNIKKTGSPYPFPLQKQNIFNT